MRYILHIGTNKTGTSSLQRALFDNRGVLREHGVAYPTIGVDMAGHHNLSRALRGAPTEHLGMPENWMEDFKAECAGCETCVVSSEHFHTQADPAVVATLFPTTDTTVVLYVREPVAYMISWYQQAIQARNTAVDLSEFIQIFRTGYIDILNRWEAVFGVGNVVPRLYDRAALHEGDIVQDFAFNFLPSLAPVLTTRQYASNPSISGNLLFIKRVMNCLLTKEESQSVTNDLTALSTLDDRFQGKIFVPEDTARRVRSRYQNDIRDLRSRYGLKISPHTGDGKGNPYPDLPRLKDDFELCATYARDRSLKISEYLERLRGFSM